MVLNGKWIINKKKSNPKEKSDDLNIMKTSTSKCHNLSGNRNTSLPDYDNCNYTILPKVN